MWRVTPGSPVIATEVSQGRFAELAPVPNVNAARRLTYTMVRTCRPEAVYIAVPQHFTVLIRKL